MALTAEEIIAIAKILPSTPTLVTAHIAALGATVTAELETAIRAELARWTDEGFGSKFVKLHPTESNMGVETNSDNAKADIRSNLIALLEWPYAASVNRSYGTMQIG